MKKYIFAILFFYLGGILTTTGQEIDTKHITYPFAKASLNTLKELLAIPNDAHFPADIEKNIQWCETKLKALNFSHQRLSTPTVPLLLASYNEKVANQPTVMFYIHIDGQPVDSNFWYQKNPYEAVLKDKGEDGKWKEVAWNLLDQEKLNPEWRIYARSSSDDKSPFIMLLTALESMKAQKQKPPYNLKVILDFEEEIGSPNLAKAVVKYKQELAADMLVIYDGPKHLTNQPTIAFGARGITTMTIKILGASQPLHSGHYGNYAPNPGMRLSQLLAGMKDDEGRVSIPGYYDGITLNDQTKEILASVPDNEEVLMHKLGIGEIDGVGKNYQESIQYPSLNIRGLSSGWVGNEARTIVPADATAELDLRLVVESDGNRLKKLIRDYITSQGYYVTDKKPDDDERKKYPKICQINASRGVTNAFRTDFDSDLGIWVTNTIEKTFGQKPIRVRTMGGTLPISPFINTLEAPAVIVPLVNHDNNQHSPNENLRLGNYFDGVKAIYGLLTSPISTKKLKK